MFESSSRPRVFAMPPGADFPKALAEGLRARLAGAPPEAMGHVTVFLNTSRMRARVRAAFQAAGPGFLPRLRLVTDLGADPLPGLAAPVPPLRRRLELAVLVQKLVEADGTFAAGTAVYDLADSLADLLAEMQAEGVDPAVFETPGFAEDHAAHWERSLRFLRIVGRWAGADAGDADARQRLAVERLIARWHEAPPDTPVIVAGSTGSRGPTALLMAAAAGLPQGAVVLPGFDFDMPEPAWAALSASPVPDEDHPQYRFLRLLDGLGLSPSEVMHWREAQAADPARNRLVSLTLRPAPVTDQWLAEGGDLLPLAPSAAGLTLIEAKTPRQEALAIALILRRAAENGRSAALVAPDRTLARRVSAALDRWGIRPDDSAGQPLHLSPPGRFLRHIATLFGRPVTVEALLTLLKHPLTATGGADRGEHLRLTRDLELHLRRHGPPFPDGAALRTWADGRTDRDTWADWLGGWVDSLPEATEHALSTWIETLLAAAGKLAAGPDGLPEGSELWQKEAGRQTKSCLEQLAAEAIHGGTYPAGGFADLLGALLEKESVRDTEAAHPLIAIQGTREAREIAADLVILGGLNEASWPQAARPDPWLSRQMRLKAGLLLPERQIGLAAHDFQQAIAAPEAILTRAIRDDEAETVPSRWLDRLTNLMRGLEGEGGALDSMRARGRVWLDLAERAEAVERAPAAPRPAPRPPVEHRPAELPVTAVRTLIRDPYAVYARYILRLRPLDPLLPEPDARLRGQVLHKIVERFVGERPDTEIAEGARTRLLTVTDEVLEAEIPWASARRLWRARIGRVADRFIRAEAARADAGTPVALEDKGKIALPTLGFTLTARPDRIDVLEDGTLHIYDYKSGATPTPDQQKAFEKQLLLEAAMAERGAFGSIGARQVSAVTYIGLGTEAKERTTTREDGDFDAVWADLERLIALYQRRSQGYIARRAVFEAGRDGDYDQLARFGEWQMADPSAPENVG